MSDNRKVDDSGEHRSMCWHQNAIGLNTKPDEANPVPRSKQRDGTMASWVQGPDLRSAKRLAPGLDF